MLAIDVIKRFEVTEYDFNHTAAHEAAQNSQNSIMLDILRSIAENRNTLVEAKAMCSIFLKRMRGSW